MKGKQLNSGDFPDRFKSIIMNEKNLFYFYSPNCSACKVQAPIIEKLKSELKNIYSIDISKDVSFARTFGIMATPSVVVVNKGRIEDYLIGVQKEETLKSAYYKN
ncbi:MAG: thioredoxin family protein [Ignavibacteria bacterium]|nr:thioredoxin family protein [Ignavibacteria bacterium]